MKTSELTGRALDWAVARCMGREDPIYRFAPEPGDKDWVEGEDYSSMFYISGPDKQGPYSPSTDRNLGGLISEREGISIVQIIGALWGATTYPVHQIYQDHTDAHFQGVGPTPLIAAMRCYVSVKLGDEVELPEELI